MRSSLSGQGKFWHIKINMATVPDGEHVNYSETLYCGELYAQERYNELIADFSERRQTILDKRDWPYDRRRLEQAAKKEAANEG